MTLLSLLSDILLVVATLGLAAYCWSLSRRLKAFDTMDSGIGTRVSDLTRQIDELTDALATARTEKDDRAEILRTEVTAADDRIGRLEVLLAGLEDIEADVTERIDRIDDADDSRDEPIIMPAFRGRADQEGKFIR